MTGAAEALVPAGLEASLAFVRHGESTWIAEGRFQGRGDPPLSDFGRRQAALVAERLARPERPGALPLPPVPPIAVWHSPLGRARATAEAIAAAQETHPPLVAEDGLTELAQGDWEGRPGREVAEGWPELLQQWRVDPVHAHAPGGEALPEAAARVQATLGRIVATLVAAAGTDGAAGASPVLGYGPATPRADPWAIVVAHDGIFRLALLQLLELPLERFWGFPFLLCGISVVELRGGAATLRAHNLSDHLAPLAAVAEAVTEERARRGAL
ncbi:MAG: histidine phosphatase family protein [Candidatus Limnocylindrales bacterium]